MDTIAIFGAGPQGRTAAAIYQKKGYDVKYFIDNDKKKQGTSIFDIPVLSIEGYCAKEKCNRIIICCPEVYRGEVVNQLKENGISKYEMFSKEILFDKERFISYSYPENNEDLILYHVLKDRERIFWIDIGSNDPYYGSVTQAFYNLGHHGINVDIEQELIAISEKVRPRDINVCVGIGREKGIAEFFYQGDMGGLNTMVKENVQGENIDKRKVDVVTLKNICDKYVSNEDITFLKIDVEGMEKEVLLGADFNIYRPEIIVIESTLPCTDIQNYQEWEPLLTDKDYHYVYSHGVNRYYVANECSVLDKKFIPFHLLAADYCVFYAKWMYVI